MHRTITALGIGFGLLAASASQAEERRARIEVDGLWCPSCSYIVGEAMEQAVSAEIVDFDPAEDGETAVYTVTFDDALTDANAIAARPAAYGYPAVVLDVRVPGS